MAHVINSEEMSDGHSRARPAAAAMSSNGGGSCRRLYTPTGLCSVPVGAPNVRRWLGRGAEQGVEVAGDVVVAAVNVLDVERWERRRTREPSVWGEEAYPCVVAKHSHCVPPPYGLCTAVRHPTVRLWNGAGKNT